MSIGVRTVYEAPDGPAGLDIIRSMAPDVVILDWFLLKPLSSKAPCMPKTIRQSPTCSC